MSRRPLLFALVLVATGLVFAPGLLGDFVWDDKLLILTNRNIQDLSALPHALTRPFWDVSSGSELALGALRNFYRPVVTAAYALQFQAFGPRPFGYHVVNLALHLASVALVYAWLRRRLLAAAGRTAALAAAVGAALFALHPTRPESVTWISGCTDLWMTFFALLALTAFERLRGAPRLLVAAPALVLAFFSKEAALVVPLALAADALLLPRAGPDRRRPWWPLAALAAVVAAAAAVRFALVPFAAPAGSGEGVLRGAARVAASLGHYARMTAWHWPPSVQVGLQHVDAAGRPIYAAWSIALGVVVAAVLAGLAFLAWRRPRLRPWFADAAWFAVPLAPVLNLVPLGFFVLVAARFLYFPLLGVAALAARAVAALAVRRGGRTVALAVAAPVLLACGLVSSYQVGTLHDDETLFAYEHRLDPSNLLVLEQLAALRVARGRPAEAAALMAEAWAEPDTQRNPVVRTFVALAAAADVMQATSDADQTTLLAVRRFYDDFAAGKTARLPLGNGELALTSDPAATAPIAESVRSSAVDRAMAHARTLDLAGAARLLEAVVGEAPDDARAWSNLMLVRARALDWDGAVAAWRRARRIRPDDPALADAAARLAATRAGLERAAASGDATTLVLARAQAALDWGAPELARAALAPALQEAPTRLELVMMRARADVADGRFDRARELLTAVRARDPGRAVLWDTALRNLATEEARGQATPDQVESAQ